MFILALLFVLVIRFLVGIIFYQLDITSLLQISKIKLEIRNYEHAINELQTQENLIWFTR